MPAARIGAFARSGMGASLTWPVFCVDNHVAMTETVGVVGDLRLTADLDTAMVLDHGMAWAVCDVRDQEGRRSAYCWRDVLRREVAALAALGIAAKVGNEIEFVLTDAAGQVLGGELGWPCYGAGVYAELGAFPAELCDELDRVGIPVEQIHTEYGLGQFEISLPPREPITAADNVIQARIVIAQVARRHGLRASFSPVPYAGNSGNGAHLHVSFTQGAETLLSGGEGHAGMRPDGLAAIGGLVAELPATMAVLAGTVVSDQRLQPGHWSGAWSAWGVENREVAVRVLVANRGNPHGANIEVKCADAGANPWLSAGLILGLARTGIDNARANPGHRPPAPTDGDPAALTEAQRRTRGIVALPCTARERIAAFETSTVVRDILGAPLHDAVLAVRRHEATAFDGLDAHRLTRFAWSA